MSFADMGFGMDGAKVRLCRQERRTASVGGVIHVQKHAEPTNNITSPART